MPRNVDPKIVEEWIENVRQDLPEYIRHAIGGSPGCLTRKVVDDDDKAAGFVVYVLPLAFETAIDQFITTVIGAAAERHISIEELSPDGNRITSGEQHG